MKTDFKVYKRKIHVWMRQSCDYPGMWTYLHSTNAHKTCKSAALSAGLGKGAHLHFKASFAKATS